MFPVHFVVEIALSLLFKLHTEDLCLFSAPCVKLYRQNVSSFHLDVITILLLLLIVIIIVVIIVIIIVIIIIIIVVVVVIIIVIIVIIVVVVVVMEQDTLKHDNYSTVGADGDVGSARYEPALLPPCPTIWVLSYSNCQRSAKSIIW